MLDIFNKKKIKRLYQELEDCQNKLITARVEVKVLKKELDNSHQNTDQLLEENKKLIEWIKGILEVTHVCDTNNTLDMVTIPIVKREKDVNYYGSVEPFHQEDIIIPTIRFTTINGHVWR